MIATGWEQLQLHFDDIYYGAATPAGRIISKSRSNEPTEKQARLSTFASATVDPEGQMG
jgi:hypothetical protein